MKISNEPGAYGFIAGAYFLLVILLLTGCLVARGEQRSLETRKSTAVSIENICFEVHTGDGSISVSAGAGAGSGVMIGNGWVLTAEHVVDCAGKQLLTVTTPDGRFNARVDKVWLSRDVARVHYDTHQPQPSLPRVSRLVRGTTVCTEAMVPKRMRACGPVVEELALHCPKGEWCNNFRFDAEVLAGNSGGPMYDRDGNLVALVTGGAFIPGTDVSFRIGYGTSLWPIKDEIYVP